MVEPPSDCEKQTDMQNNNFLENQIKSKKKKNITAKDKEKVKEKLFIQGMLEWKKQKNLSVKRL